MNRSRNHYQGQQTDQAIAPEEFKKEWQVSVMDGTVAFGSAYHNWGITIPYMKKSKCNHDRHFPVP